MARGWDIVSHFFCVVITPKLGILLQVCGKSQKSVYWLHLPHVGILDSNFQISDSMILNWDGVQLSSNHVDYGAQ